MLKNNKKCVQICNTSVPINMQWGNMGQSGGVRELGRKRGSVWKWAGCGIGVVIEISWMVQL